MKSLFACFKGEFKKLWVRKKYIVLLIITVLTAFAGTGILSLLNKVLFAGVEDISLSPNMVMAFMPIMTSIVLPLFGMMAVCDLFAYEYQTRTIKAQLLRPVTRFKIYISKLFAAFFLCVIIMAVMFAVLVVCGLTCGNISGIGYALAAYGINLVPLFVLILMAVCINQVAKNPVLSMFLCLVIYMGAKIFGYFSSVGGSLLFTSYMEWHRLWLGSALPFGALAAKVSLLLGYGLTFFSGGYLLFIKSEF